MHFLSGLLNNHWVQVYQSQSNDLHIYVMSSTEVYAGIFLTSLKKNTYTVSSTGLWEHFICS